MFVGIGNTFILFELSHVDSSAGYNERRSSNAVLPTLTPGINRHLYQVRRFAGKGNDSEQ